MNDGIISCSGALDSIKKTDFDLKKAEAVAKLAGKRGLKPASEKNYRDTVVLEETSGAVFMYFRRLREFDWIKQGFSTRLGGVSSGIYESMNLSFNLLDSHENVLNNFKKIAKSLVIPIENMVYSKQTHTTNVLKAEFRHRGMGILCERDFDNIDGLVTDKPQICLVTSFADCIPVVLVDPVSRCIASLHSGWRGTAANISKNAIELMCKEYGTNPADLICMLGPGICESCYEINSDTASEFKKAYSPEEQNVILKDDGADKFHLDLLMANRINLINCGVNDSSIYTADICTCCNPRLMFSHRATGGRRGLMCNFIMKLY